MDLLKIRIVLVARGGRNDLLPKNGHVSYLLDFLRHDCSRRDDSPKNQEVREKVFGEYGTDRDVRLEVLARVSAEISAESRAANLRL